MGNFKKGKPRKYSKVYRNGSDFDCPYCGSNWIYKNWLKDSGTAIKWEYWNMVDHD